MRLGVFGGTFDPIHIGHLRTAEEAREQLRLDRVLFVPAQVSPFKTGESVSDGAHRAEMIRLAIERNPGFALSTYEIKRPGPSYTVETLRHLRADDPDAEMIFLTGNDALAGLPRWREPEVLLGLARFVALTRPGVTEEEARAALSVLPAGWRERITFMRTPGLDISATDIRARVRAGKSIRYLTPMGVVDYIEAQGLYAAAVATTAAAPAGPAPGDEN